MHVRYQHKSKKVTYCVVECSVVWCGVVWRGVVRCGVVWCGVVGCAAVWESGMAKSRHSPTLARTKHPVHALRKLLFTSSSRITRNRI